MSEDNFTTNIKVRVTPEMKKAVQRVAKKQRIRKASEIVRRAIEEYLAKPENQIPEDPPVSYRTVKGKTLLEHKMTAAERAKVAKAGGGPPQLNDK